MHAPVRMPRPTAHTCFGLTLPSLTSSYAFGASIAHESAIRSISANPDCTGGMCISPGRSNIFPRMVIDASQVGGRKNTHPTVTRRNVPTCAQTVFRGIHLKRFMW